MNWTAEEISFELVTDDSDGDVVTIRIHTPEGVILLLAEVDIVVDEGVERLILSGAHVQSDFPPNQVGGTNWHTIAQVVLEGVNCDEAQIEGAARTTGANPGARTRAFRFRRRRGGAA